MVSRVFLRESVPDTFSGLINLLAAHVHDLRLRGASLLVIVVAEVASLHLRLLAVSAINIHDPTREVIQGKLRAGKREIRTNLSRKDPLSVSVSGQSSQRQVHCNGRVTLRKNDSSRTESLYVLGWSTYGSTWSVGLGLEEKNVFDFLSMQSENLLATENGRGIRWEGILAGGGVLLVEVVPEIIPLLLLSNRWRLRMLT